MCRRQVVRNVIRPYINIVFCKTRHFRQIHWVFIALFFFIRLNALFGIVNTLFVIASCFLYLTISVFIILKHDLINLCYIHLNVSFGYFFWRLLFLVFLAFDSDCLVLCFIFSFFLNWVIFVELE